MAQTLPPPYSQKACSIDASSALRPPLRFRMKVKLHLDPQPDPGFPRILLAFFLFTWQAPVPLSSPSWLTLLPPLGTGPLIPFTQQYPSLKDLPRSLSPKYLPQSIQPLYLLSLLPSSSSTRLYFLTGSDFLVSIIALQSHVCPH